MKTRRRLIRVSFMGAAMSRAAKRAKVEQVPARDLMDIIDGAIFKVLDEATGAMRDDAPVYAGLAAAQVAEALMSAGIMSLWAAPPLFGRR